MIVYFSPGTVCLFFSVLTWLQGVRKETLKKNTVRLGTLRCLEMKSTSLRLNPELNRRSKPNLPTSVALWPKVEYPASSWFLLRQTREPLPSPSRLAWEKPGNCSRGRSKSARYTNRRKNGFSYIFQHRLAISIFSMFRKHFTRAACCVGRSWWNKPALEPILSMNS